MSEKLVIGNWKMNGRTGRNDMHITMTIHSEG